LLIGLSLGITGSAHASSTEIDIVSQKTITNGVELLVKAYDENGLPLAWGDGTVEIEKIRVINPPRYVVVPVGTIGAIEHTGNDSLTGKKKSWWVLDNPSMALDEVILNTKKIYTKEASKIEYGKIGTTVTVIYGSVGASDGFARRGNGLNESFSTIRDGNGIAADTTGADIYTMISCVAANYEDLIRGVITFADLSTYVAGNTVVSSTISLFGSGVSNTVAWGANIVGANPGSQTTIIASDYQTVQRNKFSTAKTTATWSTTAYNTFAFNATGTAYIQAGNESFIITADQDTDNSGPACSGGNQGYTMTKSAETAGSTQDPFITIETTSATPAGPVATSSVTLGDVLAPLNLIDLLIDIFALLVGIGGIVYIKRYGNNS